MKITRNINGAIKVNGRPINNYEFHDWLSLYNKTNRTDYRPKNAPDNIIKKFLKK